MNALLLTFLFIGAAYGAVVITEQRAEGPECPPLPELEVPASPINITLGDPAGDGTVILQINQGSRQE